MSSVDYFSLVQNISPNTHNEYVTQVTRDLTVNSSLVELTSALLTQEIGCLFLHRHDTLGINSTIVNHLIENTPDMIPIVCDFLLQKHSTDREASVRLPESLLECKIAQIKKTNLVKEQWYNEFDKQAGFIPVIKFIEYLETRFGFELSGIDNMSSKKIDYTSLKQLKTNRDALILLYTLGFVFDIDCIKQLAETNDELLKDHTLQSNCIKNPSGTVLGVLVAIGDKQHFLEQFKLVAESISDDYSKKFEIAYSIHDLIKYRLEELTSDSRQHVMSRFIEWTRELIESSDLKEEYSDILSKFSYKLKKDSKDLSLDNYLLLKNYDIDVDIDLFELVKYKNYDLLKYFLENTDKEQIRKEFKNVNAEFKVWSFIHKASRGFSEPVEEPVDSCLKIIDLILEHKLNFNEIYIPEIIEHVCQTTPEWKTLISSYKNILEFITNHKEIMLNYHYNIYSRSYKTLEKIKTFYEM